MLKLGRIIEIEEGINLGIKARELFTELRNNQIDPGEIEKENSPYYERVQELKQDTSILKYIGLFIGQMKRPKEWYSNSKYLFDN